MSSLLSRAERTENHVDVVICHLAASLTWRGLLGRKRSSDSSNLALIRVCHSGWFDPVRWWNLVTGGMQQGVTLPLGPLVYLVVNVRELWLHRLQVAHLGGSWLRPSKCGCLTPFLVFEGALPKYRWRRGPLILHT